MNSSWNLLNHSPSLGPWNMAVDQYLMESQGRWIRFYQWNRPTLSLGYFQKSSEIDKDALSAGKVDMVRRLTGGKAVLHQHELTYSLCAYSESFPGELLESYRAIGKALIYGLDLLGVKAELIERKPEPLEGGNCFNVPGWYEVVYQGKKLIGSAQTRRKGRMLQHGSLLLDRDDQLIRSLFNHDDQEDLGMLSLKEILGSIPPVNEVRRVLEEGFRSQWGVDLRPSELPGNSKRPIEELIERRYGQDEWNWKR